MFAYTVTPGAIEVSDIDTIVDQEQVKIVHINLMSKYPGDITYGLTGDTIAVYIAAGRDTLHIDATRYDKPTVVTFEVPNEEWLWGVIADGSRYTVRVVLYKLTRTFLPAEDDK